MPKPLSLLVATLLGFALAPTIAAGGETLSGEDREFFEQKIRPVLAKHCYECHAAGAKEIGGKLLLDSREGLLKGGQSGPAFVSGDPEKSLLVQSLRYDGVEMPPDAPLPEAVIRDFAQWVQRGAPAPRGSETAKGDAQALDREALWSFLPIADPAPPEVANADWPRDPLDRFVLAKLEAAGLAPAPDADVRTLARRLYFDLLGLPPTSEDVAKFVAAHQRDPQAATAALVDELLARPQFGERWGRHWLDVARYGESNGDDGLGRNASFPHAWRYRDYVIDALNRDLPYDRFITEQIAGDLLPAETADERNRLLVATGFLAIGAKPAAAMNNNFAMDIVDDQINAVCAGLIGLSVSCARCHDHKHDPIPTRDYYALAGIFSSTETLYGLAANEKLTAPPTELCALKSSLQSPDESGAAGALSLADDYDAAIKALEPALHARLSAPPEGLTVASGVEYSPDTFAAVKSHALTGQLPDAAEGYTVAFWFRNETKNNARPITAYLFSRAAQGDKGLPGDHLGIGGSHDKART
ncbi:MAG: DUF1549 domain-containing protein, partial [Planctomycetales bacterium]|nr:DUF1549 domain-containing protein [Planctomycetales bacterium]